MPSEGESPPSTAPLASLLPADSSSRTGEAALLGHGNPSGQDLIEQPWAQHHGGQEGPSGLVPFPGDRRGDRCLDSASPSTPIPSSADPVLCELTFHLLPWIGGRVLGQEAGGVELKSGPWDSLGF